MTHLVLLPGLGVVAQHLDPAGRIFTQDPRDNCIQLSDTAMPGLANASMFQGSLWTRTNSPVWQNVFARLQQDQGRLLIFPDERAAQQSAQQPLQIVPLRGSEVSEFGMASGGRFFERALRIRGGQETDGNSAFGLVSPAGEHIFAAEDGVAHAAWQRK